MIKTLCDEVKELKTRKDTIDSIRENDSKNIKKPAEWSVDKSEYTVWHVLFTAYLATFDKQWTSILKNILKFGSGKTSCKLSGEKVDNFLMDNGINKNLKDDLQETLFITAPTWMISRKWSCDHWCSTLSVQTWLKRSK